jgi:5'/3'-nucleotidase
MRILLTNDDGIFAPGIDALRRHAPTIGDVTVVAPADQQSGGSHAITLYQPILARKAYRDDEFIGHMVRGTPVDCVKLALGELMDERPDVLISGVNDKANFGISVLYSATVAAAIEGALAGIHSIAISVAEDGEPDLDYAAELACDLAREAAAHPRPKPVLLNVNVPALPRDEIKGVKWIRHNVAPYTERFEPLGKKDDWHHYQIHGVTGPREQHPGDDVAALINGYVTITPLRVDFTDHDELRTREG